MGSPESAADTDGMADPMMGKSESATEVGMADPIMGKSESATEVGMADPTMGRSESATEVGMADPTTGKSESAMEVGMADPMIGSPESALATGPARPLGRSEAAGAMTVVGVQVVPGQIAAQSTTASGLTVMGTPLTVALVWHTAIAGHDWRRSKAGPAATVPAMRAIATKVVKYI